MIRRLVTALDTLAGRLWDEVDAADRLGNLTPVHVNIIHVVAFLDRVIAHLGGLTSNLERKL